MSSNNIDSQIKPQQNQNLEIDNNSWFQARAKQLEEIPLESQESDNPSSQKSLDLRWLLRTAKRKAILIIGITSLTTTTGWYLNSKSLPIYEGNFQLLVEPVTSAEKLSDPSTLTRTGGVPNEGLLNLDYPTIIQILTSPGMLSDIVKEIKTQDSDTGISSGQIKEGLKVKRLGGASRSAQTKILSITYQGIDPTTVQLVLETAAQKYLRYSLEERKSRIGQGVQFIEQQLPNLYKRVTTLQRELQKIQEQNGTIDTAGKGESLFAKVRDLEFQQLNTNRELQELKNLKGNLEKQLKLTPNEAIVASTLTQDPNYQRLLAKLKEIESQIAIQSARFRSDSPNIQSLDAQRQNLLSLLNKETQDILGQNLTEAKAKNASILILQNSIRIGMIQKLTDTANQIQLLEIRNQALAKDKKYFEQQAQRFPNVVRKYNEIQRQLDISQRSLNQLLTQRETLRIEAAQSQVPWEIISQPHIPLDAFGNPLPISSGSNKKLLMGLLGGLFFGITAAVLIEKSRDTFYTVEDMEDIIKSPLLGQIPVDNSSDKAIKSRIKSGDLIQSIEKQFIQAEVGNKHVFPVIDAYNSLYSNLRFGFSNSPINSLIMCAAEPGDDSTKIALQLAQIATGAGERVLLIDTNFSYPQVHSHLDLPNLKGLSDLLYYPVKFEDVIQKPLLENNLFVLTSGTYISHSARLLTSARMGELMAEFSQTFDLVIYNTTDVLSSMEATFIATHTDATLMCATIGKTKKSAFIQALEHLEHSKLPTLGIVANQVSI
ncbi:GumC family protein [Calothrix rhizosoleniae]|uniref:GumC family protein n=1 Tax=Calothrix rhizosoleniae TaxID=888997 RepID=UPI000B49C6CB|nr:tyrosine-protein kinase domain-containing protein [Calothrix rhizosoleniae]